MTSIRRPIRVVVTSTIPMTAYLFHRQLLEHLVDLGLDVCLTSSPDLYLDRAEREIGIRVHRLPMAREVSFASDLRSLIRWVVFLWRDKPDVIIAMTPKASLLALTAARLVRVPRRVYLLSGLRLEGASGMKRRVLWLMERLTVSSSHRVIAVSHSLATEFVEAGLSDASKVAVPHHGSSHGVDTTWFAPLPETGGPAVADDLLPGVPVVGCVGRLTADKGIDALIQAMQLLTRAGVSAQLLVVGSQDEPDSAMYLRRLNGSGVHVVTSGHIDDVRPYYALMDVHVLATRREGFPNVVLESAAMGIPSVTTTATGAVDSVVQSQTGLLVPVDDAVALARAITSLIEAPEHARRLGAAARTRVVDDFQPADVIESICDLGLRDHLWRRRSSDDVAEGL